MSDTEPYRVGKNHPPKDKQFQKGHQPSPRRRLQNGPIDLAEFFNQLVTVDVDGARKKLHPFEIALTNLADRALKGNVRAALRFIEICAAYGVVDGDNTGSDPVVLHVSYAWDFDDYCDMVRLHGPPPWPGRRDGLYRSTWREEVGLDD